MTALFSTSALERSIWIKTFDDGIYDIFLGWLLLWMGMVFILSAAGTPDLLLLGINLACIAGSTKAMHYAKKRIVFPRTGQAVYCEQ